MDFKERVSEVVREVLQPYLYDGDGRPSLTDDDLLQLQSRVALMSQEQRDLSRFLKWKKQQQLRGCL